MTVFQKVAGIEYKPDECWVNPSPAGLWARVAVVSMWTPLVRTRKTWDDKPAVIGLLRTIPGIDLLVRGLLANPQVRVVVIDGTDASADKATSKALFAVWRGESHRTLLGDDVGHPEAANLVREVTLLDAKDKLEMATFESAMDDRSTLNAIPDFDRSGGAVILPPPPPKANAPAPHGDPGERVAGDTLADVWPVVLQRIMAFGRPVPTQYGETRELLNLVSVIRDPAKSIEDLRKSGLIELESRTDAGERFHDVAYEILRNQPRQHPVLGLTYAQVADYARQFLDPVPPGGDGTAYAYGARFRGIGGSQASVESMLRGGAEYLRSIAGHLNPGALGLSVGMEIGANTIQSVDQISKIHNLLESSPGTRAGFLTTWRPNEDSGLESGRPCLVGATFRTVPEGPPRVQSCADRRTFWQLGMKHKDGGRVHTFLQSEDAIVAAEEDPLAWVSFAYPPLAEGEGGIRSSSGGKEAPGLWPQNADLSDEATYKSLVSRGLIQHDPVLHLTVVFRSHDMHGAYPLNIASMCLWLCEEARSLGMTVGTLTCMSQSAHIYSKGYNAVQKVIDAHVWPAVAWDQRSTWRVEVYETEEIVQAQCDHFVNEVEEGPGPAGGRCIQPGCCWYLGDGPTYVCETHKARVPTARRHPLPRVKAIRAVCLTPDGNAITCVFEGRTASGLLREIERSGLLTAIGGALWLGGELVKAEAKL
jgi:hypothetical protein